MDDDPVLEVATPVQEAIPPVMESTDQAPASASQTIEIGVSGPATMVHSYHDTLPAIADAPAGLVIMPQNANIPSSPPALVSSSSAPSCSPTTRLIFLVIKHAKLLF